MRVYNIFLIFSLVMCTFSIRAEIVCGNSNIGLINTTYKQSNIHSSGDFILTIVNEKMIVSHKITQGLGYLRMRCDKLVDGRDVLIVNPWCSGRSCEMQEILGVIDVSNGKYLIELPRDYRGNTREAAEKLLQKKIVYFSCDDGHHIEDKIDRSGDICIETARDQG